MQNTQFETKQTGDIVKQLVQKQAYEVSKAQAKKFVEYLKEQKAMRLAEEEYDIEVKAKDIPTVREVMVMGFDENKYLKEINQKLKEEYSYWTGMQRARWIGHALFGSE